jgi:succinate dehydrogenase / fumarate reductase membrane anchor subunit
MANDNSAPHVAILRSGLGRARGLGSAKSGYHHWWAQRVTAVALVPLTLWFICSVIRLLGVPHEHVVIWMQSPLVIVLLLALIAATFHHMQLGLQVVIEDYMHADTCKVGALLLMKGVVWLLGLLAAVAVLKVGL